MAKYTKKSDLLIDVGESIKMQEKLGILIPKCKFEDHIIPIENLGFAIPSGDIEFPLCGVEGKPVFVRDELYDSYGRKVNAEQSAIYIDGTISIWADDRLYDLSTYSWNPPKPATVMVELLREDAEVVLCILEMSKVNTEHYIKRSIKAINKALGEK